MKVTLWGVRSDQALDFVEAVNEYSLNTNAFGIIIWRVFSVDLINFFVRVTNPGALTEPDQPSLMDRLRKLFKADAPAPAPVVDDEPEPVVTKAKPNHCHGDQGSLRYRRNYRTSLRSKIFLFP